MARKKREAKTFSRKTAESRLLADPPFFAVPGLVALFSLFAWSQRGVYEDGFFYLRVVDVFLHGGGLAYNPGERFETNTDFLWTLLLIPGVAAGLNGILWMQLLGVAVYASALFLTFLLARKMFPAADSALVALILLGGHYSFAHFAATGFAPVLQSLAAVCCLLALLRFGEKTSARNGAMLGCALLFLALCRLDSAVFGLPLVLCAAYLARRAGKASIPALAFALGIPFFLFGGVLLWKLSYYGDIFPATYYAKSVPGGRDLSDFFLARGAGYLAVYWRTYFLWALAGVAAFGAWKILRTKSKIPAMENRPALLWTMAAMCALWHAYMLRTGGDLTEFRFMMPQAPMMMILAATGLRGLARRYRWAAAVGVGVFSVAYGLGGPGGFEIDKRLGSAHGSGSLSGLGSGLAETPFWPAGDGPQNQALPQAGTMTSWRDISLGFRRLFASLGEYPPEIRVAHPAGGLAAYTAPLLWTEMRGWADARIGRAGPDDLWWHGPSIGHSIIARPKLLARLGVNLVTQQDSVRPDPPDFSRPVYPSDNPRLTWAVYASASPPIAEARHFPADSQLFSLPAPNGGFVPVLYFNRNQTIDRILDERGIERVNVFQ